ncbi:MAG: type I glyceraldehyde-3-phosphate dehydrogenase [Oceanococcus sp.]
MTIRVAINGYGRIGRNVLRALFEAARTDIEIVAINDLGAIEAHAHLSKYDTAHGRFAADISVDGADVLVVNGQRIKVLQETDPSKLPWAELDIDLVMECTGRFADREAASAHLRAGARRVLISQPAGDDVKAIVFGVNHQQLSKTDTLISNASCTTNCLATLVLPLLDSVGIESGLLNTIHAYTNDQVLTDSHHADLRRARSATQSIIPTKTGAAVALSQVIPQMKGRLNGFALRVPTVNVAMVDLTFRSERATSVEEINTLMREASQNKLVNLLGYSDQPLVSVDFNHDPRSAIYDASLSFVSADGRLIKVCAWYDNEWGFSNRMLDTARAWMQAQ